MEIIYKLLLIVHIVGGSLALICGPIAIAVTKGMKIHRLAGKIFTYSMVFVSLSAFFLSVIHPNIFLFVIAGFSIYMTLSGFRLATVRRKPQDKIDLLDRLITFGMILFALGMIGYGIKLLTENSLMGVVLIVFGCISMLFVVQDFRYQKLKENLSNQRLVLHIGRMIGATIAAYTAFLVVNNTILPGLVAWLGPTVIGVPFIIYYSVKLGQQKLKIVVKGEI